MTISFAFRYAVRSLLRERQRSLLAVLCIGFGVLSLVSMQLLSASVQASMGVAPVRSLGGDVRVMPADRPYDAQVAAELLRLRQRGVIRQSVEIAPSQGNLVRREGAPRGYYVMRAFGVDAEKYPLVGEVQLVDGPASARDVLARRGAVIVTRDLARKLGVRVGDVVLLSGEPGAPPARLVVGGVAQSLPDRRGDTMLYGLSTASLITDGTDVVGHVLATLGSPSDTLLLRAEGWSVMTAQASAAEGANIAELFGTMLKGAGLLGLLIGGVGVANTLQVVLARRTPEIATLKTLGYEQKHLLLLFALETLLLGVAGAVVGVAGALVVGRELIRLMSGMESALLLEFGAPFPVLAGGLAIGMITALVFGLHAIVRTSAVRPAVLLRNLPVVLDRRGRALIMMLHAVLLLTIFGICWAVLGSPLRAVGLTVAAAAGLVVIGGLLTVALRMVLLVPVRGLAAVARRNLARHPVRSAFALTALFAGVFSIALAATVFLNGRDRVLERTLDVSGEDLLIYGDRADSAQIRAVLARHGTVREHIDLRATTAGAGATRTVTLRGVEDLGSVDLMGASTWGGADALLLPGTMHASARSALFVVNGEEIELRVAGRYRPSRTAGMGAAVALIPIATARRLADGRSSSGMWAVDIPVERIDDATDVVAAALPGVTVVSPTDFRDFMNRVYRGLFRFVAGVSALALLAGVVLVANAVGLSLVERRRELGVLKALGYGRSHVLTVIAFENSVLGCVGGTAGVLGVYAAIVVINAMRPQAELSLAPAHASALVVLAIGLTVATAMLVAWRTTGLRPLVVLREE